ncbi:MAG: alpha/beta hydrolase [Planctomycetota bacterium]
MNIASWWWFIWKVVRVLLISYVLLAVLVFLFQHKFVYHPSSTPMVPFEDPGIPVESCWIKTADGVKLHGWWMDQETDAPVLLFFHGNGGNLTHRVEWFRMLHNRGLRILAIDYRGYGQSGGSPSEEGLYSDAEAAYDYLITQKKADPNDIISYGKSLGTAVALRLALSQPVAGVVLESPFISAEAMAREMFPFLPPGPFVRSDFGNADRIGQLTKPVLIIHGDNDEIVPFEQGRVVFEAATGDREFYRIDGAGHNNLYKVGGEPYLERITEFCHRVASHR